MNSYISITVGQFNVFPVRKAGLKSVYLLYNQFKYNFKNQFMSKVLTKCVQNKVSRYFFHFETYLTKPASRCVREMAVGILKPGSVFVNKIVGSIQDTISLSQTTKRFRNYYNKNGFFMKLLRGHINIAENRICHGDYILFDGSDIQKRHAKMMKGLDYVKDGDKASYGLGYWLLDVVHFNRGREMTPLFNKLYSFDCGIDRPICRDFIIGQGATSF